MKTRQFFTCAIALLLVPLLTGCAASSRFARSAVQYNLEAEQVQNQGILLNILRASLRRPMVFSTISSISGSQLPGGELGIQLADGAKTIFSPTLTAPSGPSVTVGIVETQEFYQGILKPLDEKTIDFYVHRGLPKMMLFQLFISQIDVSPKEPASAAGNVKASFRNTVGNDGNLKPFHELLAKLIQGGLTTEKTDHMQEIGPPMTAGEITQQHNFAAEAAKAGLKIKELSWCDLSVAERAAKARTERKATSDELNRLCEKSKGNAKDEATLAAIHAELLRLSLPPVLYRLGKSSEGHRLCFSIVGKVDSKVSMCGRANASAAESANPAATFLDTDGSLCILAKTKNKALDCSKTEQTFELAFTVRSTYGVIYYLGEVVRRAFYPDQFDDPPAEKDIIKTYFVDLSDLGNARSAPIFVLAEKGERNDSFLQVTYDELTYAVPPKESAGQTYLVLDLVTELIALNRSAKDVPTTNIITAIGR